MSYRDDLQAALSRARSLELEVQRLKEAQSPRPKEKAVAVAPRPPASGTPARRFAVNMAFFGAGAAITALAGWIGLAVFGVGAVWAFTWIRRHTLGLEGQLEMFLRDLRHGQYEIAYQRVHREARAAGDFAAFCQEVERLRIVPTTLDVRDSRFRRPGARLLTGTVVASDGPAFIAAVFARDETDGSWKIANVTLKGASILPASGETQA